MLYVLRIIINKLINFTNYSVIMRQYKLKVEMQIFLNYNDNNTLNKNLNVCDQKFF